MKKQSFIAKYIFSIKKLLLKFKTVLCFLIVTGTYATNDNPITKNITYNVVKNNKVIGTIDMNRYTTNDSIVYNMESHIQTKLIFEFNISGKEKSVYKNDVLVFSSVFRKVNQKIKTNHTISYSDGYYKLNTCNEVTVLNLKDIKQNLIGLYFKEPKEINMIYCDNLKQMVSVKSLKAGVYRVDFTNNSYNIFHYKNGKCVKIEANNSLFNVTLIPA